MYSAVDLCEGTRAGSGQALTFLMKRAVTSFDLHGDIKTNNSLLIAGVSGLFLLTMMQVTILGAHFVEV